MEGLPSERVMNIISLEVSNFKSFDELRVELRPLNVVVGANASGKSSFLEIFRFLRDLVDYGLEDAVSLQGGMRYLANLRIGATRPASFEVSFGVNGSALVTDIGPGWNLHTREMSCRLSLKALEAGTRYEILEDSVTYRGDLARHDEKIFGAASLLYRREGQEVRRYFVPDQPVEGLPGGDLSPESPALEDHEPVVRSRLSPLRRQMGLSLFDFDPKLPKKGTPRAGRARLEPDGSNLALVIENLFQDEKSRETFLRLLRDLLPFVEDLRVEKFADRSLLISLQESFSQGPFLPASFLSDGTLRMAALVFALYFERSSIAALEEPDRNIHPHLIIRLMEMLKDASARKQILVTTHSPELVKYSDLEDLLLVSRNKSGFSQIHRPAESTELRVFLDNNLGVEDLYVQNLLDIGHGL